MAKDVSRRNVLGGAVALGTVGVGGVAEADDARKPTRAAVQDNRASKSMSPYIGTPTSRIDGRA